MVSAMIDEGMTIAVLCSFLLDWFAVGFEWRKIKPIAKVLAMVMVILWTLSAVGWVTDFFIILLLLGQLLGLTGDIFLLFPDRWFFAGLGAFLIGHLIYAALIFYDIASSDNFDLSLPSTLFPITISLIFWCVVLLFAYHIFKRDYFLQHAKGELLWNLVQVYTWILSGLFALILFRTLIQSDLTVQFFLLPIGGGLFLLSDILLGYNRFVNPIPKGQLWVHMTYHLAKFSLAAGFLAFLA